MKTIEFDLSLKDSNKINKDNFKIIDLGCL
jgi:hypothetical protein